MINLFENFLNYKLRSKNIKKETIDIYSTDLNDFKNFVDKNLLEVKKRDVINYVAELKHDYQTSSISRKISTLKGFYKYLLEMGLAEDNPIEDIQIDNYQGKKTESLEMMEIESILTACGDDFKNIRDKMVIKLLVETNLSINDILIIRKSELELASYKYIFTEDKSDKIKISERLSNELKDFTEKYRSATIYKNNDILFLDLSRQGFRARFMKLGVKAGIKRQVTPSMLRSTIKNSAIENEIISDRDMLLNIKTKYFEIGIGDD